SFVTARAAGAAPERLVLDSRAGPIEALVRDGGIFSVNLGVPCFAPQALPFGAPQEQDRYRVPTSQGEIELGAVSLGNPHAVVLVDSVDSADVGILGAELATHAAFPQRVNVGFVEIVGPARVRLRV